MICDDRRLRVTRSPLEPTESRVVFFCRGMRVKTEQAQRVIVGYSWALRFFFFFLALGASP